MNRRELLQVLAGAGVSLAGALRSGRSRAQAPLPERHFVFVHAGGGWDPTSLCDPKGDIPQTDDRGLINHFRQADIVQVAGSPIRYAPLPDPELQTSEPDLPNLPLSSYAAFFEDLAPDLLVINGIDMQTNGHTLGTRTAWSGAARLGQPAFAALFAQAQALNSPLAFITNGGYDATGGVVAQARISGSPVLTELAEPSRFDFRAGADPFAARTHYLPSSIRSVIERQREARAQSLLATEPLPQRRAAMAQLFAADAEDSGLDRLTEALPAQLSPGLRGQAEVALAAFQAQVAVSANLVSGGFDTHGDHDRNQTAAMARLIDGVHHLWNRVRDAGMQDRVTILVSSDFGRRPFYNDGDGKDHWNINSMLAFGAGVTGNRVIGATDDGHRALPIDPQALVAAADPQDPRNLRLTMAHVHQALRQMSGISSDEVVARYPLDAELLPIFG